MAKRQSKIKDVIHQVHLWMGLGTGLVVFIISITGGLYVFEKEIRDFTQKDRLYVPAAPKQFIGLTSIIRNFNKVAPREKITRIAMMNEIPNATVAITSNKKQVYYFNPYNAQLVAKAGQDWLVTVESLHRTLLLGDTGEFIMHWSVVLFFLLLLSGLVLWFPRQMRLLKQALTVKWNASVKRVSYDLHNVLGFYASGILIVISLSGLYFAFDGVKTAASFIAGSKITKPVQAAPNHEVMPEEPASRFNQIYTNVDKAYPGAKITLLTYRKDGELRLRMQYPNTWARKVNTFYYDGATGELTRYKLYKSFTTADQMEATNYDLHTGQLFGMFGKIVAFIAAMISASLPVTGFLIWWKRGKKFRKRKLAV